MSILRSVRVYSVLEDGLDEGLGGCELHDRHRSEFSHEKWIQSLS